jgi:nucleoid-associated protein YgaU
MTDSGCLKAIAAKGWQEGVDTMATNHITQPGDSLWSIAQRFYGDGNQWDAIYQANRGLIGDNPDNIQDGWNLTIPR